MLPPPSTTAAERWTIRVGSIELCNASAAEVGDALRSLEAKVRAGKAQLLQDRLDLGRALNHVRERFGLKRRAGFHSWLASVGLHRTTARRCMAQAQLCGPDGRLQAAKVRAALDDLVGPAADYLAERLGTRTEPADKVSGRTLYVDDARVLRLTSIDLEVLVGVREVPPAWRRARGIAVGGVGGDTNQSGAARQHLNGAASGLLAHASSPISPLPVEPARHSAAVGVAPPAAVFSAGSLEAPGNERTDALAPGVEEDFEGDDELVDDVGDEGGDGLDEFEAADDDVALDEALEDDEPVAVGASGAQLGLADLYAEIDRVSTLLGSVRAGLSSGALLPERVRAALDAAERELAGVLG
jgi:hypothetical protein